ncbi:MAG TPA: hypothetical protein VL443_06775 [Cyclobacteriaceae bacterium]|jgi:hypothetical protein|nr:hypothetical protein [Cyclobacteriaceae bacterium]
MKTKRMFVLGCLLMSVATLGNAQTINDIFNKDVPITWLGIDFTGAKFLGDRERFGSSSDVKFLIKSWNDMVEREHEKYDAARATHKRKAELHIEVTRNHNEELDISDMLSTNPSDYVHLKDEDVATIVSSYDFAGLSGVGLMFVVESFNKYEPQASIWVTFINLATKEVLLTDRILAPPGGASLRNYWGGSIRVVMEKMEKKQMEVWQKKYAH